MAPEVFKYTNGNAVVPVPEEFGAPDKVIAESDAALEYADERDVNAPPEVTNPVRPPNAPALLYCTCPLEPPGEPPPPDGVAHVPSPRQNVVEDADVPLLRCVTARLPVTPVLNGSPVQLVRTPDVGVPSNGVTKVGDVENTTTPVPVSLVKAVANCAEVNEPREVALPDDVIAPVKFALVTTVVAAIDPVPVVVKDDPVPTIMAAVVLVPPVMVLNADPEPELADIEYGEPDVPDPVIVMFVLAVISPFMVATVVAAIVPDPLTARDAPVPTTIAAVVFVALVMALNAGAPPVA